MTFSNISPRRGGGGVEKHVDFTEAFIACGALPRSAVAPRIRHKLADWLHKKFWLPVLGFQIARDLIWRAVSKVTRRPRLRIMPTPPQDVTVKPKYAPQNFLVTAPLKAILEGCSCTYINLSHGNLDSPTMFLGLNNLNVKIVVLIFDLIPIEFPEYVPAGHDAIHAKRLRNVIEFADTILCTSRQVAEGIRQIANEWGYVLPTLSVVPIGWSRPTNIAKPLKLERPYFVVVGTIEGRKNHLLLLHIWRRLAKVSTPPLLFIVGKRGWANGSVVDMLERCKVLRQHVVEHNNLSDPKLFSLLTEARALLFPSFAEGWGMPLVEALAMGVPVICSDLPVFRDVSQGCAEFIDPYDLISWEKAILDYAEPNSVRRQEALERLKAFKPPRWEDLFAEIERAVEIPGGREGQVAA
jgi:glycosyltransferase involved in cell wall biosynthesis